jgi:glycosyltransferase involved in cell wall biosynthesis
MRVLFALPGLHQVDRGAEVAFIEIARGLAKRGHEVTLMGAGEPRPNTEYKFIHCGHVGRKSFEKLPNFPMFRDETAYEELTFAVNLLRKYRPSDFDITAGCSYPFINLALRRPTLGGRRPPYVFITENGDWPAQRHNAEFKLFSCDGLVCINPDFYETNKDNWFSSLIPNGVDSQRFKNALGNRQELGLPEDRKIVLMVSALSDTKRVHVALEAMAKVPDLHLVVAGDGPDRDKIRNRAEQVIPGRFTNITLPAAKMPMLYHSADVFLHMSLAEAFGNVFIEALASGLPVVAHDISRHRWIVGDYGRLVDTTKIDDVAGALMVEAQRVQICRPVADLEARQNSIMRFDWSVIAEKYDSFFQDVISRYEAQK